MIRVPPASYGVQEMLTKKLTKRCPNMPKADPKVVSFSL
jgi:hypothetical protein